MKKWVINSREGQPASVTFAGMELSWLILCDEWTGLVAQITDKTLFLGVSLEEVLEEISISLTSVGGHHPIY